MILPAQNIRIMVAAKPVDFRRGHDGPVAVVQSELGYVPLSRTGAELLFDVFSQRHERGSTIVTSNLPFDEWTSVMGSERLTGALLDRLTHHVHILEFNDDSFRLKHSKARRKSAQPAETLPTPELSIDPETGEILEP
jgi:hypothetical protein